MNVILFEYNIYLYHPTELSHKLYVHENRPFVSKALIKDYFAFGCVYCEILAE